MEEDSAEQPIRLIIRFTTSIPDLPLTVLTPSTITTVSLKQQIRTHLPPDSSRNRLRLIHSGKVLSDTTSLVTSLRLPPPPPPPPSRDIKGKAPIRRIQTLYIHCSISDPLSPADLAAEAALAASNDVSKRTEPASPSTHDDAASSTATTTPAPRGFDRLLTAGFTPTEIASLRSQFLAIQAHTHTPDTMPSAAELRTLEDQWIDDTNTTNMNSADGTWGGQGADDEGGAGGLDDMLWGNVMGFFWPVGAVFWLLREEGVWSKRRQIAVVTGFLVNVAFSVLRVTS